MSIDEKSKEVLKATPIQEVTHVPRSSTPLSEPGPSRKQKRLHPDTPLKPQKKSRNEQPLPATDAQKSEKDLEENEKLGTLVKLNKERGDSDVLERVDTSSVELVTPSKMSQKQCLRILNTRLANNIERIGPLVAENQELTQMNELLRAQLLQEKEDRRQQIEILKARLEKAIQEKALIETDLRTSESQLVRLKDEMAASCRLFEEFRKQEAILKSEVSSLCNSASMKDGQLADITKTLTNERARRAKAEESLKAYTTKMNLAQNKLKHAMEELAVEQGRSQDLEKKNGLLQQEKVALAARINTNSEQNHHLSQELARLREEYDSLMSVHNMNIRKNFEQELGNYVPKMEYDRATSLLDTQHGEIERLRIALEASEIRQREWEQQHSKLLQEWHQDKMLLHDCRKEIKTFKLLIDQMDLATPKELPGRLSASAEAIGVNSTHQSNSTSNKTTGIRTNKKSTSCLFM